MSPSPYSTENSTLMITPQMVSLSELIELDELLPIEQEEGMKSSSSVSYYPYDMAPRKYVSFGGIQSVDYIESARDMTDEDVSDRWFTRSELTDFKRAARTLFKEQHHCKLLNESQESTRGMDIYYPNRLRSQSKYIVYVVQAHNVQCHGNPEQVAQLCEKWSTRSRERSLVAGIQDFYDAYFPGQQASVRQNQTPNAGKSAPSGGTMLPVPVQRNNKRNGSSAEFIVSGRTRIR